MGTIREKYIGDAPMIEAPKKKIGFKIKNKSIGFDKLSDTLADKIDEIDRSVKVIPQTLSDAEKTQAWGNLGLSDFVGGKYYGFYLSEEDLPAGDLPGFAYVGTESPYSIYNFDGENWSDSGVQSYSAFDGNGEDINKNSAGQLQFADREAEGCLGYKILRTSASLISQITDENTVYVIKWGFDLDGDVITIPANCTLKFEGGSLSNGTIVGNNTLFQDCTEDCLLVDFDGTFGNMVLDASWIGLNPEGDGTFSGTTNQQDNFDRLNNLINGTESITVNFKMGNYGFGGEIMEKPYYAAANRLFYGKYAIVIAVSNPKGTATKSLTINGNGCKFVNTFPYHMGFWADNGSGLAPVNNGTNPQTYTYQGHSYKYGHEGGGFLLVKVNDKSVDTVLDNFTIDMNLSDMLYGGVQASTDAQTNIEIRSTTGNVTLTRINSMNAVCDCFRIGGESEHYAENVSVKQCNFINGVRNCAAFSGGENIVIDSCLFKDAGQIFDTEGGLYQFENPWSCIDIEPSEGYSKVENISIRNCEFVDSNSTFIVSQTNWVYNIHITNCVAKATRKPTSYKAVPTVPGNAEIEDINMTRFFMFVKARESADIDNITLTNVSLGEAKVFVSPTDERPEGFDESDTTKEYVYSQYFPIKTAVIGKVNILTTPDVFDAPYSIIGGFSANYRNYKLSYKNSAWQWEVMDYNQDYIDIGGMEIDSIYILLTKGALLTTSTSNVLGKSVIHNYILELSAPVDSEQTVLSCNAFNAFIDNFLVLDTNNVDAGEGLLFSPTTAARFTPQNVHNFIYIKRFGADNAVSGVASQNNVQNKECLWFVGSNARVEESKNISRYYFNNQAQDEYRCIGEMPSIPLGSTLETILDKTQFFFTPNIGNHIDARSKAAFIWYGRNNTSSPFNKKYFGVYKNCSLYNVSDFATLKLDTDVVSLGLAAGECVFDKSTNQMIIGKGSGVGDNVKAVRYDGEDYSIKTQGTSLERPTPTHTGFWYFDTTLEKPIYAKSIETIEDDVVVTWVDANGTNV